MQTSHPSLCRPPKKQHTVNIIFTLLCYVINVVFSCFWRWCSVNVLQSYTEWNREIKRSIVSPPSSKKWLVWLSEKETNHHALSVTFSPCLDAHYSHFSIQVFTVWLLTKWRCIKIVLRNLHFQRFAARYRCWHMPWLIHLQPFFLPDPGTFWNN